MKNADYPDLFTASDAASNKAQKTYLFLFRVQLALFVVASVVGSLATLWGPPYHKHFSAAITVVLAAALLLLWIMRAMKYEQKWFDCRAIAESVKTATWRYMMQTAPFGSSAPDADSRFVQELAEIRRARPGIESNLVAHTSSDAKQITESMRTTRATQLTQRKELYLSARLRDQKAWYESKAKLNISASNRWSWAVAGVQVVALLLAIANIAYGPMSFNGTAMLMTIASTLVAWVQVKRHQDLIQPYALATQELSSLESLSGEIQDEATFGEFVIQVEDAVSREHTMWCAQRNLSITLKRA